jgi:ring-1,2-phenylacetyl-CoA epoxidase subunit PaaC
MADIEPRLLSEFLLRLADDALIFGHRLSEWCYQAPLLEEDLALANIALDLLGQANTLLILAGQAEGLGRDADALAFRRDAPEFRNSLLAELPHHHDFGISIARQFVFDSFRFLHYRTLRESSYRPLADIAAMSLKEITYHLRHSSSWVLRLAGGTDESRQRIFEALKQTWPHTDEFFLDDSPQLIETGIATPRAAIRSEWIELLRRILSQTQLDISLPAFSAPRAAGFRGEHSEHLEQLLSEMQSVARQFPDARW